MSFKLDSLSSEVYWRSALYRTKSAIKSSSLLPLETQIIRVYNQRESNFELRTLVSDNPPHLPKAGPRDNPFLPTDKQLEIAQIGNDHSLILNKYPVQIGHMLLITKKWSPQKGWLTINDLKALEIVHSDTNGLWFFNSSPKAGASQPHRHLQLLRRGSDDLICPRNKWFQSISQDKSFGNNSLTKSTSVIGIDCSSLCADELYEKYLKCCKNMSIGSPVNDREPKKPYNLLISNNWIALIRRSQDNSMGFSINALGFAGYLLATNKSNIKWLDKYGPEKLLEGVVD